jgi:hypothetical protein
LEELAELFLKCIAFSEAKKILFLPLKPSEK